ncbi:MAG: metal-dependent hydrolase [Candidatus Bathyarchaeota archaeon]|nr:metal-dependent hydrolase [Candidatus Bathyarchaeum sp.]
MYAVGHFALGYLSGKVASRFLGVELNLSLIFFASVFPDIDIVIPFLEHRGPLHSVLVLCLLFVPLFLLYRRRAVPYFVAVVQHSLIGDYLTGGAQLLWPVSTGVYGVAVSVDSLSNVVLEWVLFVVAVVVLFRTKDVKLLFSRCLSNRLLFVPLMTVLLPALLTFPLHLPLALLFPHLFFLGLFALSILVRLNNHDKT